jgi:hypothetical protein
MGKYLFCNYRSEKRTTNKERNTYKYKKPKCCPKINNLKVFSSLGSGRTTRFLLRPDILDLGRGIVSAKNREKVEEKHRHTSSASVNR